jgi:hypothetical protein
MQGPDVLHACDKRDHDLAGQLECFQDRGLVCLERLRRDFARSTSALKGTTVSLIEIGSV